MLYKKIIEIKTAVMQFACQSLLSFGREYDEGEDIFRELFFDRDLSTSQIHDYLVLGYNFLIIGNPGEGNKGVKSALSFYRSILLT